jgi:charged multivesicular body protein 7
VRDPGGYEKGILPREPSSLMGERSRKDERRRTRSICSSFSPLSRSPVMINPKDKTLISRCQQKARHHLSLAQKPIALSHLKSTKQLEDLLLKRIGATQQLEAVLRSIDQAKGDIEIVAAYTTSTSTLKNILANPALDLDHVEKTTEELAEVMANQEEVDSAIRIGGEVAIGSGGEVDDEELKRELEGMVRDEKEAQRAAELERAAETQRTEKEKVLPTPQSIEDQKTDTVSAKAVESDKAAADAEAERVWKMRYEEAQQRKKEEAGRAEVKRMRRQQKMAAE